ncbi:hypothetical protein ACLBWT_09795 [Paenibacillus sp. D51F]
MKRFPASAAAAGIAGENTARSGAMRSFLLRLGAAFLSAAATGIVMAGLWAAEFHSIQGAWMQRLLGAVLVFIYALPFHLFYGIPASWAIGRLSARTLPSSIRLISELLLLYPAAGLLPAIAVGEEAHGVYWIFAASALLYRLMLLLLDMIWKNRRRMAALAAFCFKRN